MYNTLGEKIYHSNIGSSTVKLCSATMVAANDEILSNCEGHTHIVTHYANLSYKNIHCAIICNQVLGQNVRFLMSIMRIDKKIAVRSFTALFVT
ncbi:unnamed protein product [Macrosiphum euphorbiae]|uniref:Uncharacterized protein n=1 Tax=Macrosiphum euphorbiae TaxID=13131 RepID=A0AAV0VXU7_9HEMI|nr:unnamed protein product [Macrosiphum euphorbiae]